MYTLRDLENSFRLNDEIIPDIAEEDSGKDILSEEEYKLKLNKLKSKASQFRYNVHELYTFYQDALFDIRGLDRPNTDILQPPKYIDYINTVVLAPNTPYELQITNISDSDEVKLSVSLKYFDLTDITDATTLTDTISTNYGVPADNANLKIMDRGLNEVAYSWWEYLNAIDEIEGRYITSDTKVNILTKLVSDKDKNESPFIVTKELSEQLAIICDGWRGLYKKSNRIKNHPWAFGLDVDSNGVLTVNSSGFYFRYGGLSFKANLHANADTGQVSLKWQLPHMNIKCNSFDEMARRTYTKEYVLYTDLNDVCIKCNIAEHEVINILAQYIDIEPEHNIDITESLGQ